jgi:hypothetical protein
MSDTMQRFIDRSRWYLTGECLPKIRASVAQLDGDAVWWRPNAASNSVGNLLLHLAGNLRQWVGSGIGGAPDHRDRTAEFAADGGASADELLAGLETAVREADRVLAGLAPARLDDRITVQGRDVAVMEAIYQVVEHFAMHTGQIVYIAKLHVGADLGFYEVRDGIAYPRWEGR